jgi:hypothetical protein
MATATAVEPTSSATTMEAAAAHVAVVATPGKSTSNRVRSAIAAAITVTRSSIAITGTPIAVTAAIPVHAAVSISVAAIPGAGPDKEAAVEPRRSVVSIRRARIRVVAVVAVRAHGSRVAVAVTPIHRSTDPHPNRHLSMGIGCSRDQQDTEYSEIA